LPSVWPCWPWAGCHRWPVLCRKWQIFAAGAETQNLPVILLVVFAALNSVLSLAYYAPLVNRLYRREPSEVVLAGKPASRLMGFPLVALTVFVVVLGLLAGPDEWPDQPGCHQPDPHVRR
jgi:NADH:ubiquinone oxidoreductase subunit 2 (subunit N)